MREHYTTMHERLFFLFFYLFFYLIHDVLGRYCVSDEGVTFVSTVIQQTVEYLFFFFRLCIYIKHIYVAFAPNLLALFCLRPEVDAVSYVPVFSKMRVILSSPPTKPADWDVFSLLFSRVKRVFRILRKHIRQLRCKRDTLSSRLGHDRRPPDIHTCLRFTKTGLLHVGLIN